MDESYITFDRLKLKQVVHFVCDRSIMVWAFSRAPAGDP